MSKPFFDYPLSTLNAQIEHWAVALRTLPEPQLRNECASLQAAGERGPKALLADIYQVEVERRRRRGELPL